MEQVTILSQWEEGICFGRRNLISYLGPCGITDPDGLLDPIPLHVETRLLLVLFISGVLDSRTGDKVSI